MHFPEHLESVTIGQAEIEQHHIPALTEGKRDRLGGSARLPELDSIRKPLEQLDQPTANERMIVDDEDSNHGPPPTLAVAGSGGNHAVTRVPPSPRGATSRTPPSAAARSRIPRIPRDPGPVVAASVIPRPSSLISNVTQWLLTPSAICTWDASARREMLVRPSFTNPNKAVPSSREMTSSVGMIVRSPRMAVRRGKSCATHSHAAGG